MDTVFSVAMEVRDYECDMQGIVNNAVYQHYLEHARHKFLQSIGLDFAEVTARGIHLVVARAELDYRAPLRSGDAFRVEARVARESRLRFVFIQRIIRDRDQRTMLDARITGVALDAQGRPSCPVDILDRLCGVTESAPSL